MVLNDRPVASILLLTPDNLLIKDPFSFSFSKNALTFLTMYLDCEDIFLPLAGFLPNFGWFLLIENEVPRAL